MSGASTPAGAGAHGAAAPGFTAAAGAGWLHVGTLGAFLLTLLFDGSTRFTESITRSKYASYESYQRTVSRWLPLPPRSGRGDVV